MKKLSLVVMIAAAFVLAIGTQAIAKQADPVGSSTSIIEGLPSGSSVMTPELATEQHPELMYPGLELIVDSDGDGVYDPFDNCPDVVNPVEEIWPADGWGPPELAQRDSDDDGIGDACDNCVDLENADQADADEDDVGDVCDTDGDNDGVEDDLDNCVEDPNPDQADGDGDGVGDVCDVCLDDPDPLHQDLDDCVVVEDEVDEEAEEEIGDDDLEESGDDEEMNFFDLSDEELDETAGASFGEGGGCSMVPTTAVNPMIFLLISAAFIPVATRRKE